MGTTRFLILGAGGQLGREWVNQLMLRDRDVYAYTREDLDVTDRIAVSRIIAHVKPEVVVNCAAYTQVDKAESVPETARLLNTVVPNLLADLCKKHSAKLVHYSTDYIFGGSDEDRNVYPDGFSENHPSQPQNVYGQTKWDGERMIVQSGCPYLIIRISWLCGRFGRNFVKTMMQLGRERDEIRVVDDQFGSPGFADNIVINTLALIDRGATGVYHISSKGQTSWAEFAQEIMIQAGLKAVVKPIPSSEYPTPARRPAFSVLNTNKIEQVPGVIAEDWKIGLMRLIKSVDGLG